MTTTGKIFKSYVEAIMKKHGFGSNKMVLDWSCDFLKGVNQSLSSFVPKDDPQNTKAFELWKECYCGQRFLLNEGYLREYRPTWKTRRGSGQGSLYIGLTDKGWAIADKYLNA